MAIRMHKIPGIKIETYRVKVLWCLLYKWALIGRGFADT